MRLILGRGDLDEVHVAAGEAPELVGGIFPDAAYAPFFNVSEDGSFTVQMKKL